MASFLKTGLGPRVLTGLALGAVLIGAWLAGGWVIFGLVAVVSALAQWEFCSLFLHDKADLPAKILAVALGVGLLLLVQHGLGTGPKIDVFESVLTDGPASALANSWANPLHSGAPAAWALTLAALTLGLFFLVTWKPENPAPGLKRLAVAGASLLYVPLLLSAALGMNPGEQLMVVAVPVLSDTAAYFAGVRFGRHKIWPSVSPKKSVEGAAAGLVAAVAVTVAVVAWYCWGNLPPLWQLALVGALVGVMAQLGDFFESALKRAAGVKDSGTLLPGHGGMLDRIDSILFVCGTAALLMPL